MPTITLTTCPPEAELEPIWRDLESRASAVSFFTSWTWIGSWLACLPAGTPRPMLLRAREGDQVLALALIGQSRQVRHGLLSSRALHLNATGDGVLDAIAIEYNGLLVDAAHPALEGQLIGHLLRQRPDWDECFLPGMSSLPAGSDAAGLRLRTEHKPAYWIELDKVRARDHDYPAVLDQQARYQIRKTEKAYAKLGPIALRAATTLEETLTDLEALKVLHQPYWIGRGQPGAFASDFANRFHDTLVRTAFARGEVEVLCVSVGERVLGYLYNFIHRGQVCNYQTGIDYSLLEGSISPGLLCHARAIGHYARRGETIYDLMAGDQRYKRTLSTRAESLQWAVLQRDRLKFRAEDLLRDLKRQWAARRAAAAAAAANAPATAPGA